MFGKRSTGETDRDTLVHATLFAISCRGHTEKWHEFKEAKEPEGCETYTP